jgi:CheY-like chemotaxis protein
MNDREHELFEAELHRLKPAEPPEEFMARLAAAQPMPRAQPNVRSRPARQPDVWRVLLRWLAPAMAAAAVVAALLVCQPSKPEARRPSPPVIASAKPALKADDVEIDRQLVAGFDAVARMPDGEPVRFRCREWMDSVVLRDSARGVEVEQRTPRLEVVPVGFETY